MLEKEFAKLKKIAIEAISKKDWELAMQSMAAYCELCYEYNQVYKDEEIENLIQRISNEIVNSHQNGFKDGLNHTILYYDAFGLDVRGLTLIYLKALVDLGYDIVYVTKAGAKNRQPEISKATMGGKIKWRYFSDLGMLRRTEELLVVFQEFRPRTAFFYSTPYDIAGAVAFAIQKESTLRYQINLTDHAFWIGNSVIDYCIEFRNYGAYISNVYRNIPMEKLLMLPFYPYIDYSYEFEGFPFETKGKKVIFSGGALYKTLGDNNRYYTMVRAILDKNPIAIFVYAGAGDDKELMSLKAEYPDRVYHIMERKDLYQVIKHSDVYLNTYPMGGALMMKYAAVGGKFPYTLRSGDENADGLMNQEEIGVQYDKMNELVDEVSKALQDEAFCEYKNQLVGESVISEEDFKCNLELLIEEQRTLYKINAKPVDIVKLRKAYVERFNADKVIPEVLSRKEYYRLSVYYLKYWIMKIISKIIKKRGK